MSSLPTDLILAVCRTYASEKKPDEFAFRSIPFSRGSEIYHLCRKNGILAIAYPVLEPWLRTDVTLRDLKIKWAYGAEQIIKRSKRQQKEAEYFAAICAEHNLKMVILKGIYLAQYYPQPFQRECGDIDVFFPDGYEKANAVAQTAGMTVSAGDYKHNSISSNGIVFENHQYFTSFKGSRFIKQLEITLQKDVKEPSRIRKLGTTGFYSMDPTLNALFITYHNLFHFLIEGITLRHLLDWALFIKTEQNAIDWDYYNRICDEQQFSTFGNAMNAIASDVFGVALKNSAIRKERTFVQKILDDVMSDKTHISGLPIYKRRILLIHNVLSNRWRYNQIYGHNFILELLHSAAGVLFNSAPKLK